MKRSQGFGSKKLMAHTGSESRIGGVDAAVLDGGGGVIRNEGHGLDETDEIVIMVDGESWTRFGFAFPDASQPALKTGTILFCHVLATNGDSQIISNQGVHVFDIGRMFHSLAYNTAAPLSNVELWAVQLLFTTRHYYSTLPRWEMRVILVFDEAVCTQALDGSRLGSRSTANKAIGRATSDMHGPGAKAWPG